MNTRVKIQEYEVACLYPLIGLTPNYNAETRAVSMGAPYIEALTRAGGVPVALPAARDVSLLSALADRLDGLLLVGGPDVCPTRYGAPVLECNGTISPERDAMEIAMAHLALARKLPIFAICRGIQLLNVAMGGTLIQDIPSQAQRGRAQQHAQKAPGYYATHAVNVAPGSTLHGWLSRAGALPVSPDGARLMTNSFHHQALDVVAPGLRVVARCEDGIIEAVESADPPALCVQWHPEAMADVSAHAQALFEGFVAQCAARMARGE